MNEGGRSCGLCHFYLHGFGFGLGKSNWLYFAQNFFGADKSGFHSCLKIFADGEIVFETHFQLVGVHVDIHETGVQPDGEEAEGVLVAALGIGVAAVVVLLQDAADAEFDASVLDAPAVHK